MPAKYRPIATHDLDPGSKQYQREYRRRSREIGLDLNSVQKESAARQKRRDEDIKKLPIRIEKWTSTYMYVHFGGRITRLKYVCDYPEKNPPRAPKKLDWFRYGDIMAERLLM